MSAGDTPYYSELDGGYSIYQGSPNLNNAGRNRRDPQQGRELQQPGRGLEFSSLSPPKSGLSNMDPHDKSYRYAMDSPDDRNKNKSGSSGEKEQKGILYLLNSYADRCSLNGVIFIKESKYIIAKIIWALLLLGALVVMVLHLYKLASDYYSYEKQSKVDLKFESLPFPAVTFCNVNAMKRNKKDMAGQRLQDLIASVNPTELYDDVDGWEPEYEDEIENYDENGDFVDEDDTEKRKKRSTDSHMPIPIHGHKQNEAFNSNILLNRNKKNRGKKGSQVTLKNRKGSFFDDFNFTDYDDTYDDDFSGDTFSGSWEAESEPAAFDKITKQFVNLYNKETGAVRQQMGHRIQDMLIQCSFAGRKCVQQNFTLVASSTMGNCYTIQYDKFLSRQSGPKEGLSLILYLEPDEYVAGITNAQGIKVVVHEPGTIPFPDDEGMAVSAGMETSVGLKKISITRLGDPYGDCTSTNTFQSTYNIKYTRQACQQICEMEEMVTQCGCYDATRPIIYTLLKNRSTLKSCQQNKKNVGCMEDVRWTFETNSTTCHCHSPCSEVVYRKTLSSKTWPQAAFATLIAKTVCKEKPGSDLCDAENMDITELRENFVKVNIFFETLNYEDMSEQEDYSTFQFISDIGGTVGLYVGLSVLSMFEILHLIISVFKYLLCGKS